MENVHPIRSLLDTDLYKLTMQQAIFERFPYAQVRGSFILRKPVVFPKKFGEVVQSRVDAMRNISLTAEEKNFLLEKCYYLKPTYIDYLSAYRFNPSEVMITEDNGNFGLSFEGPYYRTILWEVPLMAIISQTYFEMAYETFARTRQVIDSKLEVFDKAKQKGKELTAINAFFMEFGTRRRFSYDVQDTVLQGLMVGAPNHLLGTSNVHFAHKYGLTPRGTQAHEWFQFHAAIYGPLLANHKGMEHWVEVYNGDLGIALTDTFTTPIFYRSFNTLFAKLYDGVRQDSGDPLQWTDWTIDHYKKLRIDSTTKTGVYSNAIDNIEEVTKIINHVNGRLRPMFGIGTWFSNDVGAVSLNMVIKLVACRLYPSMDWVNCIKLSDDLGKVTGDIDTANLYRRILGITA